MLKLRTQTKHDEILHWGKIEGTVKDYYVALAIDYNSDCFPAKTFYWASMGQTSSRNFDYAQLPAPREDGFKLFGKMTSNFTGEYDLILEHVGGES